LYLTIDTPFEESGHDVGVESADVILGKNMQDAASANA
jgi:hypothetical protein